MNGIMRAGLCGGILATMLRMTLRGNPAAMRARAR
jgi:hypothetical protein